MPTGNRGPVQSIDRVLDILEALSAEPQGMFLSDLADATELHVSTVHRMVTALAARGYVRKDQNIGKYRLTLRLLEIASRVSSVLDLQRISRQYLEGLSNMTGEVVHLVERDGDDVIYLLKFEPYQHVLNIASYVGGRNPMYCTGVGKAILALLPDSEVDEIWARTNVERFTRHTITDISELKQELAEIRNRGYAFDHEEHEAEACCVACAIRNWEGNPIGAVSVTTPAIRMTDEVSERYGKQLMQITEEISRMLGVTDAME